MSGIEPILNAAAIFTSLLVLDSLGIRLPRGDIVGVGGALVAVAVQMFSIPLTMAIGIGSLLVSGTMAASLEGLTVRLAVRVGATLFSGLLVGLMAGQQSSLFAAVVIAGGFLITELALHRALTAYLGGREVLVSLRTSLKGQASITVAQVSAASLAILTFPEMNLWSLLPVLALLLLIRQAWSILLELRETYHTTLAVLVEAAVAENPSGAGHAERTAIIARKIGARCRLGARDVERLSYAALLHDIGEMHRDDETVPEPPQSPYRCAASVVKNVAFLADVVPVLRVTDGVVARSDVSASLLGLIVLLASAVDSTRNGGALSAREGMLIEFVAQSVPVRLRRKVLIALSRSGYSLTGYS